MVLTQIGHVRGRLTHSASVGYIKVQQIQRLGISCNRGIEIFQWMLNGLLRSTLRKVAVGFARGDMRGGPEGLCARHACTVRSAAAGRRVRGWRPSCKAGHPTRLQPARPGRLAASPQDCTRRRSNPSAGHWIHQAINARTGDR